MEHANWQRRRDILLCVICAGIILWAAWNFSNQFIDVILLLLLSMAIAFLISPAVNAMEKHKVPRLVGSLIVYVIVLAVLVALGYALVFSLINQVQQFSNTITNFVGSLQFRWHALYNFLIKQGIPEQNITSAIGQIQSQAGGFAKAATTNAIGILFSISNAFLDIVIVLVVSFYLTIDGKRIRDNIVNIIPQRSRATVLIFEDALNRVVGNYIRGQLTLAVIVGVLVSLVCLITGLGQFALVFGVLGFLFETIPMVGPLLASISPLLASLLLPNPFPRTVYVLICFVVIQAIESNVLGPRIVGHAVGLHPVASIMALLIFARVFGNAFGAFGGAVGALVATPLVAAAWVVITSIYRSYRGETADEMLAKRRAPWSLQPSALPAAFRLKRAGPRKDARLRSSGRRELVHARTRQDDSEAQTKINAKQDHSVATDTDTESETSTSETQERPSP